MKRSPLKRNPETSSLNRTPMRRPRKPKRTATPKGRFTRRQRNRMDKKRLSEQTLKRIRGQRTWSAWVKKVQVAYLYATKGIQCGRCEKCGRLVGLQGDHVIPKSNFKIILHDPTNGQVLDGWCNSEKGSIHTKDTDYRSNEMKRFYVLAAQLHWKQYGLKGVWQINGKGRWWLYSKRIDIPGLEWPS